MRTRAKEDHETMRSEYDIAALLKGGVRGKYDVNDALRLVLELRKIGTRRKA